MRLIDISVLSFDGLKEAENQVYGRASWHFVEKCENKLSEAPSIEAIPIQWIEQWATKDGFLFPKWLRRMIDDWRTNETDRY